MQSFEDVLREFEDFLQTAFLFRGSPMSMGVCTAF